MKTMNLSRVLCVIAAVAAMTLANCTTEKAVDNTVDGTLFVTKTAVKGVVGAGKLAVKGTNAAVQKATDSE
ncbi:hypothetical protein [Roseivivax sp. CAU 1761]